MYNSQSELLRNNSKIITKDSVAIAQPSSYTWWTYLSKFLTILIPGCVIRFCFRRQTPEQVQAWREKLSLCMLIFFNCVFLGAVTYGINMYLCGNQTEIVYNLIKEDTFKDPVLIANGMIYKNKKGSKGDFSNNTGKFRKESKACKSKFGGQLVLGKLLETDFDPICEITWDWGSVIKSGLIVIDDSVYDPRIKDSSAMDDFIKKYKGKTVPKSELEKYDDDCIECFKDSFFAGKLASKSSGCIFGDIVLYTTSVIIFSLIFARFFLALFYAHYSRKRPVSIRGTTPVICQVTCYTEGADGLKSTLDSLTNLEYNEDYKLIIVVADGQVKGSGEDKTTPEILQDLCEVDDPEPHGYISLVPGHKRYNRAKIHTGWYKTETSRARIMIVNKIGNPDETEKAGNRGKRDSQVIIMSFFSKILYNDRMSDVDVEIYRKLKMMFPQFHPEDFEILMMVDADTIVNSDALIKIVSAFEKDNKIMGLCGETRILNKFESWVTQIQVFEYYISHHLAKNFESVFGGVTCLPGCFCSYRIKIVTDEYGNIKNHSDRKNKNERWLCVPILANPIIVNPYSIFDSKTLHEKNLLHLGEDRYLTTLLMKNFYKRKLVFLASAKCSTYVPSDYKTLRSQRRRWINSTIHNMFELVMVDKLCGINVFSMQFIIGFELFGTLTLPAAIFFTFILVISAFIYEPAWIPLIMLAAILGLPAVLIFLTTGAIEYVYWLLVYIIALPIWNFCLPVYAFWRFDDFSWGDTRKVEVETIKKTENIEDEFDASTVNFSEYMEVRESMTNVSRSNSVGPKNSNVEDNRK